MALFKTKELAESPVKGMREFTISFLEEFRFNKRMLQSMLDQGCLHIISDLQDQIQSLLHNIQDFFRSAPASLSCFHCCFVPHLTSSIGHIELLLAVCGRYQVSRPLFYSVRMPFLTKSTRQTCTHFQDAVQRSTFLKAFLTLEGSIDPVVSFVWL